MTKSVLEKLGFKPGMGVVVRGLADDVAPLFAGVATGASADLPDWQISFVRDIAELVALAPQLVNSYRRGGHLWIAYPKKTGTIATDITRDHGWDAVSALDLLPVTQMSVDATWSALRFRYRDEIKVLRRRF